jgi:hypothetical protein
MRYLRATIVAAIATAALAVPSSALAQIDSLSVSDARLGPEGSTVVVTLTVQCQAGWNIAFGDMNVAQATGHKLAQGAGSFFNDFPGVPCTGAPQSQDVTVSTFTSFAFKQGKATATGTLTVFNPLTFSLVTDTTGPQPIRILK